MEIIRAVTEAHRAGAYYVRIQAMARKHHITLEQEFDAHDGPQTRYQLNGVFSDGAIEPLNEPINERLVRLVATHPGTQLAYLASVVSQSRATIKRAVAALVKSGKIEHRGSKKTGGYYAVK